MKSRILGAVIENYIDSIDKLPMIQLRQERIDFN